MKKSHLLGVACACAFSSMTISSAQASLTNGSTLLIEAGSYFDFLGNVSTTGVDGIELGTIQPYDFSIGGAGIDEFLFLGTPGMHYTTSPVSVINVAGNTATLDFTGWSWAFNGAALTLNFGTGAWGSNPDGIAEISCGVDCSNGDNYTLYYTATVPEDDPNGYAGFQYELNLTGTISAVPVPAAVWLFGSGLLGLAGMARRKKA